MKDARPRRLIPAMALLLGWSSLGLHPLSAQTAFVQTGTGTNQCRLILNFPAGEKIIFQHSWNGDSLNAKALLESVITATGGELVVTDGYTIPFAFARPSMANPAALGLVVHYQGSYEAPYLNGIQWNGPDGPLGAEYQYPDDWWHLWVQGPAHVDQSFAWPDPLPPVDLVPGSAWFFGEFSGLADLTLSDGASIGLVYGNAGQPSLPAPAIQSVLSSSGNNLQIRFSSVPGARYQLEVCQDLAAGSWTSSESPIIASGTNTTIFAPANFPSGRGFYRIGLLP